MRVAMLAPIAWRTPPRHYGPWEWVVHLLTEGLLRRGVEVTLYATGDSLTAGRLRWVCPRPYWEDRTLDPKVWEALHIARVFEEAHEFDLIHNHFDFLPLTYSRLVTTPVLTTIHGFSSEKILPVYRQYDGQVHYVAISNADRRPDLTYVATIYHGIPLEAFPFSPGSGGYLLVFGRIHREKGVREAIEVARRVGLPLVIAGIVQDQGYFREEVEPFVDGRQVTYLGSVGPERRPAVLGGARALLHLVNFAEPFGLAVIEAMACGTPVIATPRGALPELVVHGETGFLVESVDEAVAAVAHLDQVDRQACRARVARYFTVERMIDNYLEVYKKIL